MEDIKKFVIPTLSKAKISHLLSFPIGAEAISDALALSPHATSLKLHFFAAKGDGLREVTLDEGRGYEFLRIEYLNDSQPFQKYPISNLWPRPPQYCWEIVVLPVPRSDRQAIGDFIQATALSQAADWLLKRKEQTQRGSEMLVFFFAVDSGLFVVKQLSNLEPLRREARF